MNSSNEISQREMKFSILLANIFKHWRKILFVSLVFCLVLVAYKSIQFKKEYTSLSNDYESQSVTYNQQKQAYEDGISNLNDAIESLNDYSENSIYFNIDPYNETVTSSNIYISSNDANDSVKINNGKQLTQAYATYIKNLDYTTLSASLDIKQQYIKELVQVKTNLDSGIIVIDVLGNDDKTTNTIMQFIQNEMKTQSDSFETQLGPHSLVIGTTKTNIVVDSTLADERIIGNNSTTSSGTTSSTNASLASRYSEISLISTNLEALKKSLSELSAPVTVASEIRKGLIKTALIGFVIGFILISFIYYLQLLFSDKVTSEDDIRHQYGYKNLAVFPMQKNSNKNSTIDRFFINKIDNAANIGAEVALEKTKLNLSVYSSNEKSLLFVNVNVLNPIIDLSKTLNEMHSVSKFLFTNDLISSAKELEKLKSSDGVVLVIQRYSTDYKNLSKVIETINDWNKPVVGTIIL